MVEDHSESVRGNLFRLAARVLLYASSHRQDSTYHSLCYTSRGAQWVIPMKDRSDNPSHHEQTLLPRSYISLSLGRKEGMLYFTTHQTYGVGYMVKDHSDSERRNPLPPLGILFLIHSTGSFMCTIPQTG